MHTLDQAGAWAPMQDHEGLAVVPQAVFKGQRLSAGAEGCLPSKNLQYGCDM